MKGLIFIITVFSFTVERNEGRFGSEGRLPEDLIAVSE